MFGNNKQWNKQHYKLKRVMYWDLLKNFEPTGFSSLFKNKIVCLLKKVKYG